MTYKLMVPFLIVLALLAGCGGDDGPTQAEIEAKELAADQKVCEEELGDFLAALEGLDSKLTIGLSYNQYFTELGLVQVEYDQINLDALSDDCIEVGIPAESAFRAYFKAGQVWEICVRCDPLIQKQWLKAEQLLTTANENLDSYGEDSTTTESSTSQS